MIKGEEHLTKFYETTNKSDEVGKSDNFFVGGGVEIGFFYLILNLWWYEVEGGNSIEKKGEWNMHV